MLHGAKAKLLADAFQLCIEAEVDSNVNAMGHYKLMTFGSYLRINLHFTKSRVETVSVLIVKIPIKSLTHRICLWDWVMVNFAHLCIFKLFFTQC